MEVKSDKKLFQDSILNIKNIGIHRKNNTAKLPWKREGREKIRGKKEGQNEGKQP